MWRIGRSTHYPGELLTPASNQNKLFERLYDKVHCAKKEGFVFVSSPPCNSVKSFENIKECTGNLELLDSFSKKKSQSTKLKTRCPETGREKKEKFPTKNEH